MRAAGINFADILIRLGEYPQPPPLPAVIGYEVAGELDGKRVMAFVDTAAATRSGRRRADEWLFDLPEGERSPRALVPADVPDGVDPAHTAGARPRGLDRPRHAAAGGVGTAAIQLARHLGARVAATAGSEEKLALARELGAERTSTTSSHRGAAKTSASRCRSRRRAGLHREPADARGRSAPRSGSAMRADWEPVDPARLVGRNMGVQGFYLGRLMGIGPTSCGRRSASWSTCGARLVRPVVGAEYPLAEAGAAHGLIAWRRSTGKVVLVP